MRVQSTVNKKAGHTNIDLIDFKLVIIVEILLLPLTLCFNICLDVSVATIYHSQSKM